MARAFGAGVGWVGLLLQVSTIRLIFRANGLAHLSLGQSPRAVRAVTIPKP